MFLRNHQRRNHRLDSIAWNLKPNHFILSSIGSIRMNWHSVKKSSPRLRSRLFSLVLDHSAKGGGKVHMSQSVASIPIRSLGIIPIPVRSDSSCLFHSASDSWFLLVSFWQRQQRPSGLASGLSVSLNGFLSKMDRRGPSSVVTGVNERQGIGRPSTNSSAQLTCCVSCWAARIETSKSEKWDVEKSIWLRVNQSIMRRNRISYLSNSLFNAWQMCLCCERFVLYLLPLFPLYTVELSCITRGMRRVTKQWASEDY